MIDVGRDIEGVRMALEEMFEEDYARARIEREAAGAAPETRERMERLIPKRTLSPGYYSFAQHILELDAERKAGITLLSSDLVASEVRGLLALDRAREAFERLHPACSACGCRQENRFGLECAGCGIKFRRKKK